MAETITERADRLFLALLLDWIDARPTTGSSLEIDLVGITGGIDSVREALWERIGGASVHPLACRYPQPYNPLTERFFWLWTCNSFRFLPGDRTPSAVCLIAGAWPTSADVGVQPKRSRGRKVAA